MQGLLRNYAPTSNVDQHGSWFVCVCGGGGVPNLLRARTHTERRAHTHTHTHTHTCTHHSHTTHTHSHTEGQQIELDAGEQAHGARSARETHKDLYVDVLEITLVSGHMTQRSFRQHKKQEPRVRGGAARAAPSPDERSLLLLSAQVPWPEPASPPP